MHAGDLTLDKFLDAETLAAAPALAAPASEVRTVLLTGATGFLGRYLALDWLERMDLRWDLLVMRDYGDYGASRSFKQRTVAELRAAELDLRLAFEDDRRNVAMFRAEGIPCVYIHSGYYD